MGHLRRQETPGDRVVSFYTAGYFHRLISGMIIPTVLGKGWGFPGIGPLSTFWPFLVLVQSLSRVQLFATLRTATHWASLSFTVFHSLLTLTSKESVMPKKTYRWPIGT